MEVQKLFFDNPSRCLMHSDAYNQTTAYLRRCFYVTKIFLDGRTDINVVKADKGNINVVMLKTSYYEKLDLHINKSIIDGIYSYTIDEQCIDKLLQIKYKHARIIFNFWLNNSQIIKKSLMSNMQLAEEPTGQFIIPLYGTIKIHKPDMPIRPIIADADNALKTIQEALIIVLNKYIYSRNDVIYNFIMPNSTKIIESLNTIRQNKADRILNQNHILYTMDFVSMYTNIDLDVFFNIIRTQYMECNIEDLHIPLNDLISLLRACLCDFTFITAPYKGKIVTLKQNKGIPMGGKLSYHVSEIVTSVALHTLINSMPVGTFSFVYKYVDDIFLAFNPASLNAIITEFDKILPNMPLEFTREDERGSVNYLDITFFRHGRNIIHTWYKKPYASGRSINYYSAHPMHMKLNTYRALLNNMLNVSNYKKSKTIKLFIEIMESNNYPKDIIKKILDTRKPL